MACLLAEGAGVLLNSNVQCRDGRRQVWSTVASRLSYSHL